MGTLDVTSAKQQFFTLVDAISASHLPSFTIWLDAKLAEYKTIGQLKPDTEKDSNEQYPEWIAKALRQNLAFIFPGKSRNSLVGTEDRRPEPGVVMRKRKNCSDVSQDSSPLKRQSCGHVETKPCDDFMIVKEEPLNISEVDFSSRYTETPLPGIQASFSLSENPLDLPRLQSTIFAVVANSQPQLSSLNQIVPVKSPSLGGSSKTNVSFSQQQAELTDRSGELEGSCNVENRADPNPDAAEEGSSVTDHSPAANQSPSAAKRRPTVRASAAVKDYISRLHRGKATINLTSSDIYQLRHPSGGYTCPICGVRVVHLQHYRKHVMVHTDEKPFKCGYCTMRFRDKLHCYKHQGCVHSKKPRIEVHATVSDS